ncbi:MAG: hypothetical protein EXR36_07595 [Betaproteobacteria bacterium]|nr:hypothetical protein [Betaproteobacteria bacterium]
MFAGWLAALEATALARALRDSVWVYPLVNAGHILGVALLVGSIIPLDLRLLGAWRQVPLAPLWRVLARTAAAGLALAIVFGSLLFMARATEYAAAPFFIAKMSVVGAAMANALLLHRAVMRGKSPDLLLAGAKPSPHVRFAAGTSLLAWLAALTLGRLVGYF